MWSSVALAGSVDPANIGKLVLIAGIAQLRPAASLGSPTGLARAPGRFSIQERLSYVSVRTPMPNSHAPCRQSTLIACDRLCRLTAASVSQCEKHQNCRPDLRPPVRQTFFANRHWTALALLVRRSTRSLHRSAPRRWSSEIRRF